MILSDIWTDSTEYSASSFVRKSCIRNLADSEFFENLLLRFNFFSTFFIALHNNAIQNDRYTKKNRKPYFAALKYQMLRKRVSTMHKCRVRVGLFRDMWEIEHTSMAKVCVTSCLFEGRGSGGTQTGCEIATEIVPELKCTLTVNQHVLSSDVTTLAIKSKN